MRRAKQITAWVENRPDQLARMAKALAAAKISMTGLAAYDTAEGGRAFRLLASSPAKAREVLEGLGVRVTEEEVLYLSLPNRLGQLAAVSARLAEHHIRTNYIYGIAGTEPGKSGVVIAVSDVAGAIRALRGLRS